MIQVMGFRIHNVVYKRIQVIQVMGFRLHIVVYGKKRGGDEHPAAQFFIYYDLSLRFEVVENNLSVTMLGKNFLEG